VTTHPFYTSLLLFTLAVFPLVVAAPVIVVLEVLRVVPIGELPFFSLSPLLSASFYVLSTPVGLSLSLRYFLIPLLWMNADEDYYL
jgi:hypothetical protein